MISIFKRSVGLFLVLAGLVHNRALAQFNLGELQNPHYALSSTRYMPTYLGDGFRTFEIQLGHPYIGFGNNVFTFNDMLQLSKTQELNANLINYAIDKLQQKNMFYIGADATLLNLGVNILHKNKTPFLSLGFGIRQKTEFNLNYNSDLFSLVYKGNKQFAGKTIDLFPSFNFLSYTDYALSAACNFPIAKIGKLVNLNIKPAIRVRYVSGFANLNMPANAVTMLTSADGRSIDFGFDYDIHASLPVDTTTINTLLRTALSSGPSSTIPAINPKSITSQFFRGTGKGIGVDWGVRVDVSPVLSFNVGFTDMGMIQFKRNATTVSNHSHYVFEGYEMKYFGDQQKNVSEQLDSIVKVLTPSVSSAPYTIPLGKKLLFATNFRIGKKERRETVFYKHNFNFCYVQGFSDYLSSVKAPYFAVGYMYSIANVLNLGINGGLGGLTFTNVGLQITCKFSKIKVGINSNNILPLLSLNAGKGSDIGILTAMSF